MSTLSSLPMIYATRKSALALAQSRAFVSELQCVLKATGLGVLEPSELQVVTSGDQIQDKPLSDIGGKGLFVKEIEDALLERRADMAIHSLKDVPYKLPEKLHIACIPKREDPRDAFLSKKYQTFRELPQGAVVGTSSLRRKLSLLKLRPDLRILPLRGNIDTRLRKLEAGDFDAIVLASSGLKRLGLSQHITSYFSIDEMLPAAGQGALGIETREDDTRTNQLLKVIHDAETAILVSAERGVMRALEASCKTPLAAHAQKQGDKLFLQAWTASEQGDNFRAKSDFMLWSSFEPHLSSLEKESLAYSLGERLGASLKA